MNKTENPRKALGKGLGALLSHRTQAPPDRAPAPADRIDYQALTTIPIDDIDAEPAAAAPGLSERPACGTRAIHPGERHHSTSCGPAGRGPLPVGRWGAALARGQARRLDKVPVVVRDIPDEHLLEITLIENIQREDLNPIETAIAFDRMGRNST